MAGAPRGVIDLGETSVGLGPDGEARVLENRAEPPVRIDGLTIGAPLMTREPPHEGEMHPDGDEILVLLSGSVTIVLEDEDPPRRVALAPGQALVVPRGGASRPAGGAQSGPPRHPRPRRRASACREPGEVEWGVKRYCPHATKGSAGE